MLRHAILTAGGAFLATAVLLPLDRRYKAWKEARGELTLRRDRRGNLVPDLTVKRLERAALLVLLAIVILGLAIDLTIMA